MSAVETGDRVGVGISPLTVPLNAVLVDGGGAMPTAQVFAQHFRIDIEFQAVVNYGP